jgi:hypothetical protein
MRQNYIDGIPTTEKISRNILTRYMQVLTQKMLRQNRKNELRIRWLIVIRCGTSRSRCTYTLNNRPLVPHINLWEPRCFTKVPDGPQTYALNVLRLQGKGAQIRMFEWSQSFTLTQNVGQGFILCSTPPTHWTVWQPQQTKISPQGIMSSEKASNSPGLYPVKGQKPSFDTQTRPRN